MADFDVAKAVKNLLARAEAAEALAASRLAGIREAETARDKHRSVLNRIADRLGVVHEDDVIEATVAALQDRLTRREHECSRLAQAIGPDGWEYGPADVLARFEALKKRRDALAEALRDAGPHRHLNDRCCNPECGGEWETNCYCCHHGSFHPALRGI